MSTERDEAIAKLELQLIENFTTKLANSEEADAALLNGARQFWESLAKVKKAEDEEDIGKLSNSMRSLAELMADKETEEE